MSNQNEIVEFFASTRPDNPLQFLLRIDKEEAERFGTEGWYPINRGIAGFGKRLDNGETVMLHRLIMGAQPGEIVKFHDEDNTNITKKNMYIVGKKEKGQLVAVRRGGSSGRSGDNPGRDDETGDDMSARMQAGVSPFGRKSGDRGARKAVQEVVAQPVQSGGWLPIASQFVREENVVTIIDHTQDEDGRNEMDIVTSQQGWNPRDQRMEWYTISIDGKDADNLRSYLQAHINPDAVQAGAILSEYKQRVQELERENARQAARVSELTEKHDKLRTLNKELNKRLTALQRAMAPVYADDQAA